MNAEIISEKDNSEKREKWNKKKKIIIQKKKFVLNW